MLEIERISGNGLARRQEQIHRRIRVRQVGVGRNAVGTVWILLVYASANVCGTNLVSDERKRRGRRKIRKDFLVKGFNREARKEADFEVSPFSFYFGAQTLKVGG